MTALCLTGSLKCLMSVSRRGQRGPCPCFVFLKALFHHESGSRDLSAQMSHNVLIPCTATLPQLLSSLPASVYSPHGSQREPFLSDPAHTPPEALLHTGNQSTVLTRDPKSLHGMALVTFPTLFLPLLLPLLSSGNTG